VSRRRGGFSLLEVLLAMAILLGAIIVLGELARTGRQNAAGARDWSQAEMIAESLVAEYATGSRAPEPTQEMLLEEYPGWRYSAELETIDEPGLIALHLTVSQDLPEEKRPVRFELVQWIRQPSFGAMSDDMAPSDTSSPAPVN